MAGAGVCALRGRAAVHLCDAHACEPRRPAERGGGCHRDDPRQMLPGMPRPSHTRLTHAHTLHSADGGRTASSASRCTAACSCAPPSSRCSTPRLGSPAQRTTSSWPASAGHGLRGASPYGVGRPRAPRALASSRSRSSLRAWRRSRDCRRLAYHRPRLAQQGPSRRPNLRTRNLGRPHRATLCLRSRRCGRRTKRPTGGS
jgi:hypothetical protein